MTGKVAGDGWVGMAVQHITHTHTGTQNHEGFGASNSSSRDTRWWLTQSSLIDEWAGW